MTEQIDLDALIANTRKHAKDYGWYPSRQECIDLADALESLNKNLDNESEDWWKSKWQDSQADLARAREVIENAKTPEAREHWRWTEARRARFGDEDCVCTICGMMRILATYDQQT